VNRHIRAVIEKYNLETKGMTRDEKMRLAMEALRANVAHLECAIYAIGERRLELAAKALGLSSGDIETEWIHECEDERNPTGQCVYNGFDDPCWDECLFCGEPNERK